MSFAPVKGVLMKRSLPIVRPKSVTSKSLEFGVKPVKEWKDMTPEEQQAIINRYAVKPDRR